MTSPEMLILSNLSFLDILGHYPFLLRRDLKAGMAVKIVHIFWNHAIYPQFFRSCPTTNRETNPLEESIVSSYLKGKMEMSSLYR